MNFQKLELIAGLSDQHRQLFCWTDSVFAGLGHRSSGLFRRLKSDLSRKNRTTGSPGHVRKISDQPRPCPKTVDSPNTVLQKITGGIFSTQFVQCNDDGAGDKCMFLSVFTYSSNPLTQICEIVQLTRWAHRKFPQNFLPSSRHKKHGECLLLLLACKFRRSQHVNLKLWLFHVIGVKRYREAESVHWGSETV